MSKKIATITLPFSPNYGWVLQAYALQQVLKKMGFDAILLERNWTHNRRSVWYCIKRRLYYSISVRRIYSFYKKNLNRSPHFIDDDSLRQYCNNNNFYGIVVGSDQVWRIENTRGVGLNFFLDFVDSNIIKISYAASFGSDVWKGTKEENESIISLLKQFSAISVREDQGKFMCRDLFHVEAEVVLDPTLLLDKSCYEQLFSDSSSRTKELVTYILDASNKNNCFVKKVASIKGLDVINLYRRSKSPIYIYKSVKYWLSKIHNAECVIVDSFHGMVFCILFQKQFLVIENKKRGSARFISLLTKFGLMNRLVADVEKFNPEVMYELIDYQLVGRLLEKERAFSLNFLKRQFN